MYRTLSEFKLHFLFADVTENGPVFRQDSMKSIYPENMDAETICASLKKTFDIPNKTSLVSVTKELIKSGRYEMDDLTFQKNSVLLSDWNEKSVVPKVTYTFKTRVLVLHGLKDEDDSPMDIEVTYDGDLEKISDKKGIQKQFEIEGFTPRRFEVKKELNEQRVMSQEKFMKIAKFIPEEKK